MHALIKQSLWYPQKCLITVADHWVPGIVVGAIETKHVLQLHLYQWNKEIAILPVSPLYTSLYVSLVQGDHSQCRVLLEI